MRLAALYDIHGNLPALEAVLADVRHAEVDQVLIGGDVIPGPMPRETLALLLGLDVPVQFIHGNGELAVLAQIGVTDPAAVAYRVLRPASHFPNLIAKSCAGRRRKSILTTTRCSGAGRRRASSRWPGWATSSFAMARREVKRSALPG